MSRLSILATIALLLAPSSFAVPSPWRMKSNFAPPSANSNPGQGGWSPSNVQSTPSFGQSNGPTNQQPSSAIQPPPSSTSSVPLLSTGAVGQTTNGQTTTGQTTNGQTTNGQTTSGQNSTGQSYSQGSSSDLACSISDSASGSWCNADSNIYANDQTFQDQMMNATNFWRNNYGAKPVTWDATLASFANTQMAACIFDHTVSSTTSPFTVACERVSFAKHDHTAGKSRYSRSVWGKLGAELQRADCGC